MLSLREMRRAARVIQESFTGAKLRRIARKDEHSLVLTLEAAGCPHLLISVHPEFARICPTDPPGPDARTDSFCEYVRAHLTGSVLTGVEDSATDRRMRLRFETRSASFLFVFSILGARSNVYLLDAGGRLLHCMRPLEETRRELKIGGAWMDPLGAAPSEGGDRWEETPDEHYLEAIGATYRPLERKRRAETITRKFRQAVQRERSFLHRKYIHLQEDLEEARKAENLRETGELLKSVLHTVKAGDAKAVAMDHRTGEFREIPLDPRLSPAANMESYFTRYQKQSRGREMIRRQLEELEAARAELDSIEGEWETILEKDPCDVEAMENLMSRRPLLRILRRQAPKRKPEKTVFKTAKKREIPARLLPKRYRTEDGLEIWVGRSDEGNDYLTTRLARGNDLFFHLEGHPGSHVVLRTEGRQDPPAASLLDACELAVHFSRLKNASSADVHVAPIKDVKKPKGAKPGLVYVRRGKTIRLRRDPRRLENILSSRLDD